MPKQFFVNYGGPGGFYYTEKMGEKKTCEDECRTQYGKPVRNFEFEVQGLAVTVHT